MLITPTSNNEKWEITYQGTVELSSADLDPVFGGIRIVDSNNNDVDNSTVILGSYTPGGFYPNARIVKITVRDTISSPKTYKLQLRKGSSVYQAITVWNLDYTGSLTNPDLSQKMYAVKMPDNSSYVDSGEIYLPTIISSTDLWQDVLGAQLTVTPSSINESVEINFKSSLSLNLISGAIGIAGLRIVDSDNNLIDNSLFLMMDTQSLNFSMAVPVHLMARDIISSSKTYKVQIRQANANWVGIFVDNYTGEMTNPDVKAVFYAQKFPTPPTYINSSPISTTQVNSGDNWTDVSGAEVFINPSSLNEKWELRFQGIIDMYFTDSNAAIANIRIVDSSNNVVDDSTMAIIGRTGLFGSVIMQPINIVARTTISSAETYKLQIRKGSAGSFVRVMEYSSNFTSGLADPDYYQRFFAVKY